MHKETMMFDWLRKLLMPAPLWEKWDALNPQALPTVSGWYRVMISGDSETDGPHVYYEYPDYETWAWFQAPAVDDEPGYKGAFTGTHDEETEMVFAWIGPFVFPKFNG